MTCGLTHYTLNTEGLAVSTGEEVSPQVRQYLAPTLVEGAMILTDRLEGWGVHLAQLRDGWATFNIATASDPDHVAAFCYLCWDENASPAHWLNCLDTYGRLRPVLEKFDLWADPLPMPAGTWMTVLLTPFLSQLPEAVLAQVGGVQRAVAWTLIGGASATIQR